jgi:hypothetical protein
MIYDRIITRNDSKIVIVTITNISILHILVFNVLAIKKKLKKSLVVLKICTYSSHIWLIAINLAKSCYL